MASSCIRRAPKVDPEASHKGRIMKHLRSSQRLTGSFAEWGGWGSNPRPADYEKYGPALRVRYLHGYHGAVPPMALIALFASMARSTNRSTPSMVSPDASYRTLPPRGRLDAMGSNSR